MATYDPAVLRAEIIRLHESSMKYADIVRLLKRSRTLSRPRVINFREVRRMCVNESSKATEKVEN